MFKGHLLVLLLINIHVSLCVIDDFYDTSKEIWTLYMMIDNIELDTSHARRVNEPLSSHTVTISDIKSQIGKIHEQINRTEASMNPNIIQEVVNSVSTYGLLFSCMDTLGIFIQSINQIYGEFSQYVNESRFDSSNTLQNLGSETLLDIETNIGVIRRLITDRCELPSHTNLISAIVGYAAVNHDQMCDGPDLISNVVVHLFKIVNIAEMKANVILAFMNIHLYIHSEGWKDLNSRARKQFQSLFATYVNIFEPNLEIAEAAFLRACDPIHGTWTRDSSFYELEGTFQTTIFRYHWTACKYKSCNNIWFDKSSFCQLSDYGSRSRCGHTVDQCTYLSAIHACVLDDGPNKFLYVNSSELGFLGKNMECEKNGGHTVADGSGRNFTHAACACNCFSDENKISLSLMESNVKSNRVIIGLRFFRKDRILYIQPREGKLYANGQISRNVQRWVPIGMNIVRSEIHSINRENKVFFFDDLRLPPSFVLTGVKFNKVTRGNVTGFAIQIFGIPFHYKTGKLFFGPQAQISRQASNKNPGEELSFEAVNSADTNFHHKLSPLEKTYVSLKRSTLKSDFGQSTLPLFDAVAIKPEPGTALGGVGIFHKGVEGYAGFISLRVYGIKYSKYFNEFQFSHMKNHSVLFNDSSRN